MPGSLRRSGSGSALGFLFRGSFDEVHCRCNRTVQSGSCFRVRPRSLCPDPAFGREQSNSTGGTLTRMAPSFTGAHPNSEVDRSAGLRPGTTFRPGTTSVFGFNIAAAGRPPHFFWSLNSSSLPGSRYVGFAEVSSFSGATTSISNRSQARDLLTREWFRCIAAPMGWLDQAARLFETRQVPDPAFPASQA